MCPEPVLRTKKVLDGKPEGAVEVLVDSDINVMNLTRLANSLGLSLESKESEDGYQVVIGLCKPDKVRGSAPGHSHDTAKKSQSEAEKAGTKPSNSTASGANDQYCRLYSQRYFRRRRQRLQRQSNQCLLANDFTSRAQTASNIAR